MFGCTDTLLRETRCYPKTTPTTVISAVCTRATEASVLTSLIILCLHFTQYSALKHLTYSYTNIAKRDVYITRKFCSSAVQRRRSTLRLQNVNLVAYLKRIRYIDLIVNIKRALQSVLKYRLPCAVHGSSSFHSSIVYPCTYIVKAQAQYAVNMFCTQRVACCM